MFVCTHVIPSCSTNVIFSALMLLYRYFKPKALPDPESHYLKHWPSSASIKATNEAVLDASKQQKQ